MTVFVVQNTMRYQRSTGKLVEKFDLSPATQYGELHFLLPHDASPFDLPPVLAGLHAQLDVYGKKDYLLLIGSPVLIGLAVAVAAQYNKGEVAMLQWSGENLCYFPSRCFDLYNKGEKL